MTKPLTTRIARPARIPVIHVTHTEKRAVVNKAIRLGMSVAELVRQAVAAYPVEK